MYQEGEEITVVYPGEEPRNGTIVSRRSVPGGGYWYTVLYDDDESADPRVHESFVHPRSQTALEVF